MKISSLLHRFFLIGLLFLASCVPAMAQTYAVPYTNSFEAYSQMWNTSNVYRNVPYFTSSTSTNLGSQKDTLSGTTAINLVTAQLYPGFARSSVNADTFLPAPVNGYGQITLKVLALKVTGTDTVTLTPISSPDGINWFAVQGVTPVKLMPTSLTVPVGTSFDFSVYGTNGGKLDPYWGVTCAGNATTTQSVQAWYYFQRPTIINR